MMEISDERKDSTLLFPKMRLVVVSEGFVTFCVHFKYLVSWLSCSLHEKYDLGRQIELANASMGALDKYGEITTLIFTPST